ALAHLGAAADHVVKERLERALTSAHRLRVQHAADAREIAGERDPPEPAVWEDEEPDQALVASLPALRALEVGEESDLAQTRDGIAAPDAAPTHEPHAPPPPTHTAR